MSWEKITSRFSVSFFFFFFFSRLNAYSSDLICDIVEMFYKPYNCCNLIIHTLFLICWLFNVQSERGFCL